jgi:hypothetical protein
MRGSDFESIQVRKVIRSRFNQRLHVRLRVSFALLCGFVCLIHNYANDVHFRLDRYGRRPSWINLFIIYKVWI